ncbi:hypothetical protein HN51_034921 [Arachis hypogaea]
MLERQERKHQYQFGIINKEWASYENWKGMSRRLLQKRPPCNRGRYAYDMNQARKSQPYYDEKV